jgi:hypothetical protein
LGNPLNIAHRPCNGPLTAEIGGLGTLLILTHRARRTLWEKLDILPVDLKYHLYISQRVSKS